MIKRITYLGLALALLAFHAWAYAKPGLLFKITESGSPVSADIILCLNGKESLSCQSHHVTAQNLQISTVAKHYYPAAGIKSLTPGYQPAGCTPHSNGSCLFAVSNSKSTTIQVNADTQKQNQTITFTSTAPSNAAIGTTYQATAIATSGLTVTLSIDSRSSSICSIDGSGLVSFNAAGTCTVNANQAGDANYNAASQVQQIINVGKIAQTITFTSTAPSNATVGTTYQAAATATSGLAVTLSIDPSSSSICSIDGSGLVTFNATGTCSVDANQAGNANYNAAPQVQQTINIAKGNQTITFTSTPPSNATVGGTYQATATATSGLAVTLSIDSSSSNICSIDGSGVVTFNAAGTCTVNANQAGNANYNAAPQVQQAINVAKASQTINFTSTPPSNATVGGTYQATATATSGLAVTLSIDSSSSNICSIDGSGLVTFNAAGTCTVNANQAGNANYNAAPQVQQTINVAKASQTINFTSTAPPNATVGTTYQAAAIATSGLAVTLSIDSSSSNICSINGSGVVTFNAADICRVNANQAGNANYNAAPQVQQVINVAKASQTINFTSTPPSNTSVGGTYHATATASSGLAVTLSIDASSSSICSISSGVVTFNAAGTCTVDANQAGNANYNAAPQVQQNITVHSVSTSTLIYSSLNPSTRGTSITLSAQVTSFIGAPSSGTVRFTANNTVISGCSNQSLSSGVATCTTSSLTTGTFSIVATYSDSTSTLTPTFDSSTSPTFSQYIAATTPAATAPSAPTYVTAVPGNAQVTVNWLPPTDTGGADISTITYHVSYWVTASGSPSSSSPATGCSPTSGGVLSCVVTGLTNETPYTFEVTATNSTGTAPYLASYSSSATPSAFLVVSPDSLALSALVTGGRSRAIRIINNSSTPQTITTITGLSNLPTGTIVISNTCTNATLLAGKSCFIAIKPSTTVSTYSNGTTSCTSTTAAVGSTLTASPITVSSLTSDATANIYVVAYGCQYQSGYLFAINDTTPITTGIGGKVVTGADQSTGSPWSPDTTSIWGIAETSTMSSPIPNTSTGFPANLETGQLNCVGKNDGACDSNNLIAYPSYGPGTNYASGLCNQDWDNSGTSCSTGPTCYADWYLPSICELGTYDSSRGGQNAGCAATIPNIATNLYKLGFLSDLQHYYLGSSEYATDTMNNAWIQFFTSGSSSQGFQNKSASYAVRCVRALTF